MTEDDDPILTILLPVRNEAGSLSVMLRVLPPLIGTSYEILVIHDDTEDTSVPQAETARAANPKVRIVHNVLGRGVINAVRAGVAVARGRYILIFAADEIGPVFIINDMLVLMDEGCDLVSCTRYAHGGGRLGGSLLGRTLSTAANHLFRLITRSAQSDLTTGIKMFRRERFEELELESRPVGWAFAFEIAVKAEAAGWTLGEVPIISIDRLFGGQSSFRPNPWIREYLRWFIWGVRHLPRDVRRVARMRLPAYRGSGLPAAIHDTHAETGDGATRTGDMRPALPAVSAGASALEWAGEVQLASDPARPDISRDRR